MPRDKKPQKARNKKYADPKTGQFRHSDGDRRHRGGVPSRKAYELMRRLQELALPPEQPDADAADA